MALVPHPRSREARKGPGNNARPNSKERGEALRRRRLALGIKSVRELHERSTVSREAITAAEAGAASAATFERLEVFLDSSEPETGGRVGEPSQIEFTVEGDLGVRIVVRGPVTDAETLERSVARLVRTIREQASRDAGDQP